MTQTIELHISNEMASTVSLVAQSEDATVGEIIRDAVRRDLRRRATIQNAETQQRRAFDPLRNLLQPDFEKALNWEHLQSRLLDKGYRLLQGRGDIMVHRASGERICRLSDLGQNQVALARRFQVAFVHQQAGMDAPQALAG